MKKIPRFKSEQDERAFWSKHDATEYVDFSRAKEVIFPEIKPSSQSISIRLPESLLDTIKVMANQKDVPYQSLMKLLLADAVDRESRRLPTRPPKHHKKAG